MVPFCAYAVSALISDIFVNMIHAAHVIPRRTPPDLRRPHPTLPILFERVSPREVLEREGVFFGVFVRFVHMTSINLVAALELLESGTKVDELLARAFRTLLQPRHSLLNTILPNREPAVKVQLHREGTGDDLERVP